MLKEPGRLGGTSPEQPAHPRHHRLQNNFSSRRSRSLPAAACKARGPWEGARLVSAGGNSREAVRGEKKVWPPICLSPVFPCQFWTEVGSFSSGSGQDGIRCCGSGSGWTSCRCPVSPHAHADRDAPSHLALFSSSVLAGFGSTARFKIRCLGRSLSYTNPLRS